MFDCELVLRAWCLLREDGVIKNLLTLAIVGGTFARLLALPSKREEGSSKLSETIKFNRARRTALRVTAGTLLLQIATIVFYFVLAMQIEDKCDKLSAASKLFICAWSPWLWACIALSVIGVAASQWLAVRLK